MKKILTSIIVVLCIGVALNTNAAYKFIVKYNGTDISNTYSYIHTKTKIPYQRVTTSADVFGAY
ncbi:MAG: hypothetical protein ACRCWQ_05270, partial [Bacilli bacterium]